MAAFLVCEGPIGGLDDRILNRLIVQYYHLQVQIEPTGGGKGHGAVRAYLEGRAPNDVAIAIADRDYQPQATANATWTNQAGKSFTWRRHEMENYLLHPRVVLELFNDIRASGAVWANLLPINEADTSVLLQTLASPLLEDHTAEVLKHELVRVLNGIGSVSFGPPNPIPPAGAHACGQAQWLPALLQEASRLCQTCNLVAALADLQPGSITARYHTHLAQFQHATFLTSGDYLTDMAGKKILAALLRHLHGLRAPGSLNRSALADELLRVLDLIYQPQLLFQPDDFLELAAILRQY